MERKLIWMVSVLHNNSRYLPASVLVLMFLFDAKIILCALYYRLYFGQWKNANFLLTSKNASYKILAVIIWKVNLNLLIMCDARDILHSMVQNKRIHFYESEICPRWKWNSCFVCLGCGASNSLSRLTGRNTGSIPLLLALLHGYLLWG